MQKEESLVVHHTKYQPSVSAIFSEEFIEGKGKANKQISNHFHIRMYWISCIASSYSLAYCNTVLSKAYICTYLSVARFKYREVTTRILFLANVCAFRWFQFVAHISLSQWLKTTHPWQVSHTNSKKKKRGC